MNIFNNWQKNQLKLAQPTSICYRQRASEELKQKKCLRPLQRKIQVLRYCSMSPIIAVTKFLGGFCHMYHIKLHLQLFTAPSSFKITTINFKREVHTHKEPEPPEHVLN